MIQSAMPKEHPLKKRQTEEAHVRQTSEGRNTQTFWKQNKTLKRTPSCARMRLVHSTAKLHDLYIRRQNTEKMENVIFRELSFHDFP